MIQRAARVSVRLFLVVLIVWSSVLAARNLVVEGAGGATCESSTVIASLPYQTIPTSDNEPNSFFSSACFVDSGTRQSWYSYTPSGNSKMATVTVARQSFSVGVAILTATTSAGCTGSFTCLASTFPSSVSDRIVTFPAAADGTTTYDIVLSTASGTGGTAQMEITQLERPVNDECEGALNMSSLPFAIEESNTAAFPSFSNSGCGVDESARAMFYKYGPVAQESIVVATVSNQDFNVILSLFVTPDGGDCESLSCIVTTFPSAFTDHQIILAPQVGNTYYFLVHGEAFADAGSYRFSVESLPRPVNDVCTLATDISGQLPFSVAESNEGAVPSFSSLSCGVPSSTRGLWYNYVPIIDSNVLLTVSYQDFVAILSLYKGTDCGSLTCVEYTFASSFSSRIISFAATVGQDYHIHVNGESFSDYGNFQLDVVSLTRQSHDVCEGAIDISGLVPYSVIDNNSGSFPSFSSLACGVPTSSRGLWYRYTPASDANHIITLSNQEFDARVTLFKGAGCGSLSCYAYTFSSIFSSRILAFAGNAGEDYHIHVNGETYGDHGDFQFDVVSLTRQLHDVCDGAIDISGLVPYSVIDNNSGSFPSFSSLACGVPDSSRGLWYKYTPASDANHIITLSNQEFDARVTLFKGAGCGSLSCYAYTFSSIFSSRILAFAGNAGEDYHIHVNGETYGDHGDFQFDVVSLTRQSHDACEGAIDLNGSLPYSVADDSTGAFPSFSSLSCQVQSLTRGLWYKFTATGSSQATVTVSNQEFNAMVSVYSGSDCGGLSCLHYSFFSAFSNLVVSFTPVAGQTYYILVSGYDYDAHGAFDLSVTGPSAGTRAPTAAPAPSTGMPGPAPTGSPVGSDQGLCFPPERRDEPGVVNRYFLLPIVTYSGRMQQVYAASLFGSGMKRITAISFRYAFYPPKSFESQLDLRMSSTDREPGVQLSTTLDENLGSDVKSVYRASYSYQHTEIQLQSQDKVNPFEVRFVLQEPFDYDPSQGNLMIDCMTTTDDESNGFGSGSFLDHDSTTIDVFGTAFQFPALRPGAEENYGAITLFEFENVGPTIAPTNEPTAAPISGLPGKIQLITSDLYDVMNSNSQLAPKFIRLAFHDCVGFCNGCIDMNNVENRGLDIAMGELAPIVAQHEGEGMTRADIYALAGLVAAEYSLPDGNSDASFELRGYGRLNCEDDDRRTPPVVIPNSHLTTSDLLEFFANEFGFNERETVAIMGAHTLGRATQENSGFDGNNGWVTNPDVLDNEYYRVLMDESAVDDSFTQILVDNSGNDFPDQFWWRRPNDFETFMLNADMALAVDFAEGFDAENGSVSCRLPSSDSNTCPAAATASFAVEYSESNAAWLSDFEAAFIKMTENGYEYTNCGQDLCPLTPRATTVPEEPTMAPEKPAMAPEDQCPCRRLQIFCRLRNRCLLSFPGDE